ncbi:MAG: S41 family peptidase [Candidatus Acidiferrales bacterium]
MSSIRARSMWVWLLSAAFLLLFPRALDAQQKMNSLDMDRARGMLRDARDAVKKYYYDPKYHGVDLDARYQQYDERIKTAPSLNDGLRMVAAFLSGLKDSHTFFDPPMRPYRLDTGFRMELFGDNAFISRVRPGTDAESKVHPGDQILGYDTYSVNRVDFHDLSYTFGNLMPQPKTQLDLRDPDGNVRQVMVDSKIQQGKKTLDFTGGTDIWQYIRAEENEDHVVRQRYEEMGDIIIWKMPEFFLEDEAVDHMFGIVRKHKTLILDLRGDPGGAAVTLERMIGNVFDHDVKIADRIGRKELKPALAKTVGERAFTGKIIVLVDSESASAAELFARVMQLENRGTVLGDRSSGSVMEARGYGYSQGVDTIITYGFSVTEADLIMKDGKSLEHVGVTPDEIVIPTGRDLATGQDPVLARAVEIAGGKLDPAQAGKLFPFEWMPF